MHSFTMTTFFLLLVALLATPILGDYVERRGYDQRFGELERRTPTPARRRGGSSSDDDDATATESASASGTPNFAPNNVINLAGAGAAALIAGAVVVF
ncbi:hypothetical protein P167DRAFT_532663 [Morchella conica CCBAS932]|uniref:Uncharacterized protein n=2 Tax=Morchella sect. Distantes TaxID=1051054 RepID=A0A3N4L3V4_9PEZI|nr:hypothetical protein P167DRAFT_532663 [Morchella conica CCBAS932]